MVQQESLASGGKEQELTMRLMLLQPQDKYWAASGLSQIFIREP